MEKKDIALKQLRRAVKVYKEKDYVCAITLAGAAEEILGKIALKRTGSNELERQAIWEKDVNNYLAEEHTLKRPLPDEKEIKKSINRIRNELKHNDTGENVWLNEHKERWEYEASGHIIRAVKNYFNAYNEMPKDRIIMNVFYWLTM